MQSLNHIEAIAGVGLEGDRCANRQGTFSKPECDFELALIEAEVLGGMAREYRLQLEPGNARRL